MDADLASVVIFDALADPVRLRILQQLADGELRVTDLRQRVGGSQANISEHLGRLRSAGLVVGQPEGRQTFYRLADPGIMELIHDSQRLARAVAPADQVESRVRAKRIIDILQAGEANLRQTMTKYEQARTRHQPSAE